MKTRITLIALAAALLAGGSLPVHAQSAADFEALKAELQKLRQEVEALKRERAAAPAPAPAAPAATPALAERVEQVELRQKDAVVAGDTPGSFRLPGSDTSVRIYGHAEAHLVSDLRKPGPNDVFTDLMSQPLDKDGSVAKRQTRLTASTSRLGFETSTPTAEGAFTTKLETDFYSYGPGNRNRLRLRHAYGEYAGWLIGQTWSTFMDLDNLPETVDFNGPIGSPFSRRMMVRYTYADPKAGYKVAVALEDPESGARLPNLVARYDRSFDWGAVNLRLLGHEKRVGAEARRGSGIGLGASYKLTPDDLLMAQWARVNGDYDMMYGSTGYAVNAGGQVLFDKNDGLVVGWAHAFSPKLRSNLVFGMNRSRADAAFVAESAGWFGTAQARWLKQLHAGIVYVPVKNLELGAEYIHGIRTLFNGDKGTMSRFDLMARYSF